MFALFQQAFNMGMLSAIEYWGMKKLSEKVEIVN